MGRGGDLTPVPNILREERLRGRVPRQPDGVVQYACHIVGEGEKLLRLMCDAGQEGIIAKKADAPYSGRRTMNWLKIKCTLRQEFVIVGWTTSKAKGRPFASLVLAQNSADGWRYAGRVGTGRSEEHTSELQSLMRISYAVFCLKKTN